MTGTVLGQLDGASSSANTRDRSGASSMRRLFILGWTLIALVFGGLLVWSIFAPFQGAVLTTGKITVESNQQAVQHLEGGIVEEIFVREGDTVDAGQALLALDATAADATLSSIEARLFELLGAEARLIAERDGSKELAVRSGFAKIEARPEFQVILTSQQELMLARSDNRRTQISILGQRVAQLQQQITGYRGEMSSTSRQIATVVEELNAYKPLLEKGLIQKPRILALEREQARLEGQRDSLSNNIATTQVQIGEAQSERARLTQTFRETVLTELRDVQTQIEELTERRVASVDQQERLVISAPRAGRVIGVRAHTVGGVITPSEPLMYIVPEDDALVAKVQVMLMDIDKIQVGQPATLRFTAFNMNTTPEVKGKVKTISADAITDEMTGMPYYEVVIEYPVEALSSDRFTILPGMPVDALVQTESRSVISYLLKPLTDSMQKTFRE